MYTAVNMHGILVCICRVKKVQVSSTKYCKDDDVVLDTDDDGEPVLGRIKDVYVLADEQCVFTIECLLVCFHSHYHAYKIVDTANTIVVTPDTLLSYHPHNTHTCFSPSLSQSQFVGNGCMISPDY